MIRLSNGHELNYVVASGALAFRGLGWWWERPLVWVGLIKPKLFTVCTKTVTLDPLEGNLSLWHPWTCIRKICGGNSVVNKVGLTNKGFTWFVEKVLPRIEKDGTPIIVSLYGTEAELSEMVVRLRCFTWIIAIELNVSCPNTGHKMGQAEEIIDVVKLVEMDSAHPIIIKVSVDQDYIAIARGLKGIAEAISINSVPWHVAFPDDPTCKRSPLQRLMNDLLKLNGSTGGGGGVSGKKAQEKNWKAVQELADEDSLPVIGPSIMGFEDLGSLDDLGAEAYSFGAVHILRWPWVPTQIVKRHMREKQRGNTRYRLSDDFRL